MTVCHSARGRGREGQRESARKREGEKDSGEIGLVLVLSVWHYVTAMEEEKEGEREWARNRRREREGKRERAGREIVEIERVLVI